MNRKIAPPISPPSRIHLTIDRLTLQGFAPEQRDALVVALQDHLRGELVGHAGSFAAASPRARVHAAAPDRRVETSVTDVATDAARRIVQSVQP